MKKLFAAWWPFLAFLLFFLITCWPAKGQDVLSPNQWYIDFRTIRWEKPEDGVVRSQNEVDWYARRIITEETPVALFAAGRVVSYKNSTFWTAENSAEAIGGISLMPIP
mgnify:FL=1